MKSRGIVLYDKDGFPIMISVGALAMTVFACVSWLLLRHRRKKGA